MTEYNIFSRPMADGHMLVYQPLSRHAALLDSHSMAVLAACVESGSLSGNAEIDAIVAHRDVCDRPVYRTGRGVDSLRNMMLLPNNVCNFKCAYCYSADGRNGKTIDKERLYAALGYFLDPQRAPGERLTISVLGGGEPLLAWPLLRGALDHAYELARRRGMPLPVSVVTNGSILSDDILDYMKAHSISVSVSFDILPRIQNMQRGHYDVVVANVRRMVDAGLDIAFNTVITPANVDLMDEMVDTMLNATPGVRKVSFKSLITNTMFATAAERRTYYRSFVDNFFQARRRAYDAGIWLTSPYLNNALCVSDRFCPGKFVLTSEGDLSICHCVGSSADRLYDRFVFGHVGADGSVEVDEGRLLTILAHDHNRSPRCGDCIARWHCAGGCYADNCTVGDDDEDSQEAYCESMRYFIEKFVVLDILGHDE